MTTKELRDNVTFLSAWEDWELVDVYADEGLSGLEARKREEFNRMIADCRDGKIDRVLVKSTSRFARNTTDYIRYVRELLRLGISICFEKENIDTGKITTEQIAQIYGAFSQIESTNHSNNMWVSVRMRMEKGIFVPPLPTATGWRGGSWRSSGISTTPTSDTIPFRQVPNLMAFCRTQFAGESSKPEASVYSKRIVCGDCGSICRRKVTNGKTYWVCNRHDDAKSRCPVPQVPEANPSAAT